MRMAPFCVAGSAALLLSACTVGADPGPGTPEFTAARVSRGYDCGIRVDRARILAHMPAQERRRFVVANADYAVKSYKAPKACGMGEREEVRRDLQLLAQR